METEEIDARPPRKSHKKGWLVFVLILLTLAVGIGIYLYFNYLRKTTADPIEMVPADAALMVQVNNYEDFVKATACLRDYVSDAVPLGALDGMQYFIKQFSESATSSPMACSAHEIDGRLALLLSLRITDSDFENLLEVLEINDNNFHEYKSYHIYEVETHYRTFSFCFHDGAFTVSESEKLLYASLDCLAKQKSIVDVKGFQTLREMMDKNPKQNWLVVNHAALAASQKSNVSPAFADALASVAKLSDWSAYQMDVSSGEMTLFGYSVMKDGSLYQQLNGQHPQNQSVDASIVPASAMDYACFHLSDFHQFSAGNSLPAESIAAFNSLQSNEIHCFTLTDSLSYHFFAVKCNTDSAHILSLLPDGYSIDSVGECGSYPFGRGNFAPVLHANWWHCTPAVFMQQGDYLIFTDSVPNLRKYQLAIRNGGINDNQHFIFTTTDGHWAEKSSCRFFFNNASGGLKRVLSSKLLEKNTSLTRTSYIAFYCLEPYNNLIPNNLYIKFLTQ